MEFINDDGDDGGYDVDLAVAAEANEKDMTFKDARRADLRLIWYSLGFSGTIIMEGYGLALITYLFSFSEFNKNFGEFDEAQNSVLNQLPYLWRVMLPLVAQLGSLVGILLASPIATRIGYKRTMLTMLVCSIMFTFIPYFAKNVTSLMAGFLFLGMPGASSRSSALHMPPRWHRCSFAPSSPPGTTSAGSWASLSQPE